MQAVKCAEAKKLTLLARYNAVSGKYRDALNVDEDNPRTAWAPCALDALGRVCSHVFDSDGVASVASLSAPSAA